MGKIKFTVNGEEVTVRENEVCAETSVVMFLRTRLELRGTKFMCREGACGACIVSAVTSHGGQPKAINACLAFVINCHGWQFTTIEKVGNKRDGYHPIQKTLAEHHGTQCGHCSPGWVMAMYSLAQSKKDLTQLEIENSFGSNICRCTGYRPIMDAFKTFAVDAPNSRIADIEDLYVCKKSNKPCTKTCGEDDDWCFLSDLSLKEEQPIEMEFKEGKKWYIVTEIKQIFDILLAIGDDEEYMLVCGGTARGAYPIDDIPNIMIGISGVSELVGHEMDQNLVVGANTTLTEFMEICETVFVEDGFKYLKKIRDHIEMVAHIPVRNVGSIAGNLMTKHKHNKFASDVFLLLETIGAYLTILDSSGNKERVSMQDFLKTDMKKKIIYNILLPPLNDSEYKLESYKVMPRAQSVHAVINVGLLIKLSTNFTVDEVRLVIGGLSPSFIRATETEKYLVGKKLFTNETLQGALKTLKNEAVAVDDPPAQSPTYREHLALTTVYKCLLSMSPESELGARQKSGSARLYKIRPVSTGKQEFDTNPSLYPLNQPIQKVEGLIQCAGEAPYTEDVPSLAREVFGALVLTTVGRGNIESIDPTEALNMPGVIAFYSAKDIPGKNTFTRLGVIVFIREEELFCSKEVKYYNQPCGIIVAETIEKAERAAKRVKITYSGVKPPMIDIKEARKDKTRSKLFLPLPAIGRGLAKVHKKFESNYTVRAQLHFCMETVACVAEPTEHGLAVHSSTQWMDGVQYTVSQALDIDMNRVDVYSRRLGGAFGLKLTRNTLAAVACSLAAFKLNRPCRVVMSFSSVARALGKRFPASCDVKVQVSEKGAIQYMDYDIYEDNGWIVSELVSLLGIDAHSNSYNRLWWNYKCYDSTTDTASNTYCRSPGAVEAIAMTETLMDQIATLLSLDPFDVRINNMDLLLHSKMKEMAEHLRKKAEYDKRKAEVEKFNRENRWRKRGLSCAFMKHNPLSPAGYQVSVCICHRDGSVIINHTGIEIGQGINTKIIQVCAHLFNIPIDKVKVKPQNTTSGDNGVMTAASLTSQSVATGVAKCCNEILLRLAPIRLLLLNPSWQQLIRKAFALRIDLKARHFVNDIIAPIFTVYGVAISEVEVDILTGECQVRRVDLYEDVGQSVSPQIDVGQVEGAFIMGLSYWIFENVVYDKVTGEVKSDRPWDYLVAQCKDIPQDFRISFKKNSYSAPVAFGAKVTGEPAVALGIVIPLAIRRAIASARSDSGLPLWYDLDGPHTTEKSCLAASTPIEHLVYK